MGSWSRTVLILFLTISAAVLSTPLINKLQPDKEWPQLVKQPSQDESAETISEKSKGGLAVEHVNGQHLAETVKKTEPEDSENEDDVSADIISKCLIEAKDDFQKVDYTGAQLWKVSTEKNGWRVVLNRLRRRNLISTWGTNGTSIDILVQPNAIQNVTNALNREKIHFEIIIEDLQARINQENPPLDENEIELQDRRGHRMNWKQYHRLEDIYGFLDYLAKTYPAIVSVKSIGNSHEGREIKLLRISNGNPTNKAVFIDGGIHAREWISPATVTYFINQFAENFDVEDEDIKNIDWYFVPVLNPDGYEYTHLKDRLWRKNRKPGAGRCSGVDLNRNFGYRWGGKGTSNSPCDEIYRGPRAFSEPESKAIQDFFKSSASEFSAYLTYHSYGQYILYPWGYDNAVPPDHLDLNAVGKKMATAIKSTGDDNYSVGSSSNLLYPAAGGSDDWAKSIGIKYTYTIELNDRGFYGFVLPTQYIEPVAKESLAGLRVLAAAVHTA
nr:unnamed protein product [Amyelois transitella]